MKNEAKNKWYDNKGMVFLLLFVFFPVGLYALWKNSKFSKITKIVLTVIVTLAIVIFSQESPENNYSSENTTEPSKNITTEGKKEKSFTNFVSEQAELDSDFAKVQNDPDFQDWIEIEKRTVFKRSKKWLEETLEWLRTPTHKWCACWDHKIDLYLDILYPDKNLHEKWKTDEYIFTELRERIESLKKNIKESIIRNIYYKEATSLSVSKEAVQQLAFNEFPFLKEVLIEESSLYTPWKDYRFYKDNKKKGTYYTSFYYNKDIDGVMQLKIPLLEVEADYINLPNDPKEKWLFWKDVFQRTLGQPNIWRKPLGLIFNEQEKNILFNKVNEIISANDDLFKKIVSSDSDIFALWNSSFPVGNKWVIIDGFGIKIVTNKTYKIQTKYWSDKKLWEKIGII